MVNYETMINGITIPTSKSETITAEILTSSPMFPEETLEEQVNIPEDGKNVKSIVHHSTARTLKQYKPDPYGRIKVRTTEQLFRQAKENSWYKWVEFTGKKIEADNCYVCSRNRQKALYVIVTDSQSTWTPGLLFP